MMIRDGVFRHYILNHRTGKIVLTDEYIFRGLTPSATVDLT